MTLATHYSFSLLLLSFIRKDPSVFLYSLISLLPDIDIKWKKHRGITHSFFASFVILAIFRSTLFFLPYFSHIILDYLTYTPIPLLWPLKGRYALRVVKTGGTVDRLLTLLFLILFLVNYLLLK